MTGRNSERGFTLLEVLVASLLLGMLITILTMVFNSSSIAWSTGKATVTEMDVVRNSLSVAERMADNLLPGVKKGSEVAWGVSVGPWDAKGALRRRAVEDRTGNELYNKVNLTVPENIAKEKGSSWLSVPKKTWAGLSLEEIRISGSATACIVGVWSYGPDGLPDTDDDICTWPDVD